MSRSGRSRAGRCVHRPDDRTAVGGHGGEREEAHPDEAFGDLFGGEAPLRGDDAAEMWPGVLVASVEQLLEGREILRRLMQERDSASADAAARAVRSRGRAA